METSVWPPGIAYLDIEGSRTPGWNGSWTKCALAANGWWMDTVFEKSFNLLSPVPVKDVGSLLIHGREQVFPPSWPFVVLQLLAKDIWHSIHSRPTGLMALNFIPYLTQPYPTFLGPCAALGRLRFPGTLSLHLLLTRPGCRSEIWRTRQRVQRGGDAQQGQGHVPGSTPGARQWGSYGRWRIHQWVSFV